jgi:glutamate--cysteine ligase catalytic subunit
VRLLFQGGSLHHSGI